MIKEFQGEYRFLSNFYTSPFFDKNLVYWKTVEHFYQANKAYDLSDFFKIKESENPSIAKKLGKILKLDKILIKLI